MNLCYMCKAHIRANKNKQLANPDMPQIINHKTKQLTTSESSCFANLFALIVAKKGPHTFRYRMRI